MKVQEMADTGFESVVRVVFPERDQEEVLPLYAIDWSPSHLSNTVMDPRTDVKRIRLNAMNQSEYQRLVGQALTRTGAGVTTNDFDLLSRRSLRIHAGGRISLCTFFNAFPAGYWRRWTRVDTVRLTLMVWGRGEVRVMKSNGRGIFTSAGSVRIEQDGQTEQGEHIALDIPMTGLVDGGYCWLEAQASKGDTLTIKDADWQVPIRARTASRQTSVSVAITTFNRAPYCLRQLQDLAAATELRSRLDTIYCTDQGNEFVSDQEGYGAVAQSLGDQLTYMRQRNLGGSGGFSRGMYETLKAGRSDYVLLLDDDAISEPESILRAVQFADYACKPMLVGGGMFHLDNRTVLYTQGERLNWKRMWMEPSQGLGYNHDFALEPLPDCPERHQRIDEDFNGWWMCLIPISVIREIGLSLPVFIKFDDVEYCLRAQHAGYPTVCLPGVAVWHQAWHEKDPARTWEEYYTERNRWLAALLLEPELPVSRIMTETLYGDASLGLRFTYSAMALRNLALQDLLRGPQYIVETFPTKLDQVRRLRAGFTDAQTTKDLWSLPAPDHETIPPRKRPQSRKHRMLVALKLLAKSVLTDRDATRDQQPDTSIAAQDAAWTWVAFDGIDSALVTSPDGDSVAWLKRDNSEFRRLMGQGCRLALTIRKHWKEISAQYRDYGLASLDTWQRIFANSGMKVIPYSSERDGKPGSKIGSE